jgi:glucose/arabinose dehydrogenase
MKLLSAIFVFFLATGLALGAEPDGLVLQPGFHATVVAESLGAIRHLAVRDNGDIYVQTEVDKQHKGSGIIALHLDASHKAAQIEHFGTVDGGTGIRFYKGALYASSPTAVYRFDFAGKDQLLPQGDPKVVVEGIPAVQPGLKRNNVALAFDPKRDLFVAIGGSGNFCTAPNIPTDATPVGLKPCPDLGVRSGVWRFNANKLGQKFSGGEQIATGIRDTSSLDWSPLDGHLYGIMHGSDNTHKYWPNMVSEEEDDNVADEMHLITKGTNFGWPYTYYDGVRKLRLVSPEYGGNGKETAPPGVYSTPVLTFQSRRPAPVDLKFYSGNTFPQEYRGGAFVVLHGSRNKYGYDIVFVPFNHQGRAGDPQVFADGFAAFDQSSAKPTAKYRPVGVAVGPDGSLYVADSQTGRIWRIAYGDK